MGEWSFLAGFSSDGLKFVLVFFVLLSLPCSLLLYGFKRIGFACGVAVGFL